jgi:hypothetical protein
MIELGRIDSRRILRSWNILAVAIVLVLATATRTLADDKYVRYDAPPLFSFEELVALGEQESLDANLAQKLHTLSARDSLRSGGRPKVLPFARAFVSPDLTRSPISDLSNCATAPII